MDARRFVGGGLEDIGVDRFEGGKDRSKEGEEESGSSCVVVAIGTVED